MFYFNCFMIVWINLTRIQIIHFNPKQSAVIPYSQPHEKYGRPKKENHTVPYSGIYLYITQASYIYIYIYIYIYHHHNPLLARFTLTHSLTHSHTHSLTLSLSLPLSIRPYQPSPLAIFSNYLLCPHKADRNKLWWSANTSTSMCRCPEKKVAYEFLIAPSAVSCMFYLFN